MEIDLKPSVLIGRGYLNGGSYAAWSPFSVVFTVKLMGDQAFIEAMHGEGIDREAMATIGRQLHDQYGVLTVLAERNGRIRRYDVAAQIARERSGEALAEQPAGLGQPTVL